MRKTTENAIKTLLLMDTSVTREERTAVVAAMLGAKGALPDPKRDMTVSEAADYLGLGRSTMWRMCKDGRVECDRRGKKFFVRAASVVALRREEKREVA